MKLFDWKMFNWNYTKCKAFHSVGKRKGKLYYTFYIVDYDIPEDYEKYEHIIEMRNAGVVKTKYFHKECEARDFINKITSEKDAKMMKKIKMKYVKFKI